MDGNRRWAKKNLMKSALGHYNGKENLIKIMRHCQNIGVKTLTVYALSTENLKNRDKSEVKALLKLLETVLSDDLSELKESGCMVKIMGSSENLPESIIEKIENVQKETYLENPGFTIQICINYGGRDEIVRCVKKLVDKDDEITQENIAANLDSSLEPDLIIRTGGDIRISNFLLWQAAYSEYYFTEVLWPDFNEKELDKAIHYLKSTKRNFGK